MDTLEKDFDVVIDGTGLPQALLALCVILSSGVCLLLTDQGHFKRPVQVWKESSPH